jgi:hypothetical protein
MRGDRRVRLLAVVGMAVVVACSATAPEAPSNPTSSDSTPAPHTPTPTAPDTVALYGVLVGGGDWSYLDSAELSLWGDSISVGESYNVPQHYYFRADNAAGDSIGAANVASVDSVPFLDNCPVPAATVCQEDSVYNCPAAMVLLCPPSVDTTDLAVKPERWGDYLVWLTPGAVPGAVVRNPGTRPAFLLFVAPTPASAASPERSDLSPVGSTSRGRSVSRAARDVRLPARRLGPY